MTSEVREAYGEIAERAAIGASIVCLVHCLALPFLLAALPALGSFLRKRCSHATLGVLVQGMS